MRAAAAAGFRSGRIRGRLAAVPTDPGVVLNDIWLLRLRALLARAHGDEAAYRTLYTEISAYDDAVQLAAR